MLHSASMSQLCYLWEKWLPISKIKIISKIIPHENELRRILENRIDEKWTVVPLMVWRHQATNNRVQFFVACAMTKCSNSESHNWNILPKVELTICRYCENWLGNEQKTMNYLHTNDKDLWCHSLESKYVKCFCSTRKNTAHKQIKRFNSDTDIMLIPFLVKL